VKLTATTSGSVRIAIHAKPRAKKSRVVGIHGEALSLAIAAPPVDGAANKEVVRFLAELFGVAVGRVTLIRGTSARMKLFDIDGTNADAMRGVLDQHL
jgi:uncharacterized protein (TIGR00251 family)